VTAIFQGRAAKRAAAIQQVYQVADPEGSDQYAAGQSTNILLYVGLGLAALLLIPMLFSRKGQ